MFTGNKDNLDHVGSVSGCFFPMVFGYSGMVSIVTVFVLQMFCVWLRSKLLPCCFVFLGVGRTFSNIEAYIFYRPLIFRKRFGFLLHGTFHGTTNPSFAVRVDKILKSVQEGKKKRSLFFESKAANKIRWDRQTSTTKHHQKNMSTTPTHTSNDLSKYPISHVFTPKHQHPHHTEPTKSQEKQPGPPLGPSC